ncbi:MAG TPA: hypothetical protein VJT71_08180 [Pyrinomonadaceae bacterium]|nr:hypothetical protein [Pyrinomonadaceae bacterium]
MKLRITLITIVLALAGCTSFSVKPISNAKEQAKAEKAVSQFHNRYNERKFDEIYSQLDKQANQSNEEFMFASTEIFSQWGKLQATRLDEARVIHSTPLQVKMIYNSTFEKGNAQEWFTWTVHGDDVRLFAYNVTPGWDK